MIGDDAVDGSERLLLSERFRLGTSGMSSSGSERCLMSESGKEGVEAESMVTSSTGSLWPKS